MTDNDANPLEKTASRSSVPDPLAASFMLLTGLVIVAFIVGMGVATGEHLRAGTVTAKGASMTVAVLACGGFALTWIARRLKPALVLPRSPNMRRARISFAGGLLIAVIVGVLGAALLDQPHSHGVELLRSTQVKPSTALVLIVGWLAAMAPTLVWYRSVDEHERRAYDVGASAAAHLYLIGVPVWWMAWRGGFAEAPDAATIYALTVIVWTVGWLWRRAH